MYFFLLGVLFVITFVLHVKMSPGDPCPSIHIQEGDTEKPGMLRVSGCLLVGGPHSQVSWLRNSLWTIPSIGTIDFLY
jgi:hypothetical protein